MAREVVCEAKFSMFLCPTAVPVKAVCIRHRSRGLDIHTAQDLLHCYLNSSNERLALRHEDLVDGNTERDGVAGHGLTSSR